MSLKTNDLVCFEEYVIDRPCWALRWRDEPVALNRKSFDLLLYLVDHRHQVVGKNELMAALWPGQFVEEGNLTQHISLLRKALSRHPSGSRIIETVQGRGYRFVGAVEQAAQPDQINQMVIGASESITRITAVETTIDEDETEPPSTALGPARLSRRSRTWLSGILAAALLAAVWFGYTAWKRWMDRTGGPPVQVVLGGIDGGTGDPALDVALVAILRMQLTESPFLSVVSDATVRTTLKEMKRQPDAPLTTATAREVCERTNSQAVLHGTVARSGRHFLLIEEAISCTDGSTLAAARQETDKPEELPRSTDKLAETLRRKLGESRRSVARFSAPLFPATTASLDALKAYSQAGRMAASGKTPDAINLLRHAVALDPQFAMAYHDIWAYSATVAGNPLSERAAIQKAYDLRDSAGSLERLAITDHYNMVVVGDLFESEQNYRTWAQLYPRSVVPWNGLTLVQGELGRYADAVVSATRAVELKPKYVGMYSNLAMSQAMSGDPQAARATCDRALALGLDGDRIRTTYLKIAYQLGDPALLKSQRDWAATHPDLTYFTQTEGDIAIAEGRFADARRLYERATEIMRRQDLGSLADSSTRSAGTDLLEAGDGEDGSRMLHSSPPDPESGYDLVGLAEAGDVAAAASGVQAMEAQHPRATLWKMYWEPLIHAEVALANHKPADAAKLLELTRPIEARDPDLPLRRGLAYLAAGQPGLAEQEFRRVLAHRGLQPTSSYPLAWLALGRALVAEGNRTAAIGAYRHFLTMWAHADPDAMFLKQARQEFAALTNAPAP